MNPAPSKAAELTWMATKGTAWVVKRSTDLVPSLLGMAIAEWRLGAGQDMEAVNPDDLHVDDRNALAG
jgi:hypothetical protein